MPDETPVTELTRLDAERVSGVTSMANGTPFLLLKASSGANELVSKDEADDVEEELTKSPGVPATSLRVEPSMEGGRVRDTGLSGKRIKPMTQGARDVPTQRPQPGEEPVAVGGASRYVIPDEDKVRNVPPAHLTAKALAFAGLAEFMDRVQASRETATKAQLDWLAMPNPLAEETPGSPAWESVDATTLADIAKQLAQCARGIDAMAMREMTEAVSAHPRDIEDAAALKDAGSALDLALGIVARLSFMEATEAAAKASGSALSGRSIAAIRAVHNQLGGLLSQQPSQEESLMLEVTKAELAEGIAQASVTAVTKAMEDARKSAAKVAKAKAKKAAAKKAKAKKESNNKGDLTADQMKDSISARVESNDVGVVAAPVADKYKNAKKGAKSLKKQLLALSKAQQETTELVAKFAAAPRRGGPVLDGVLRGAPASEGRHSETAVKSATEGEIESLKKQLEEELSKTDAGAMDRASAISWQLTRKQLREGHLQGEI